MSTLFPDFGLTPEQRREAVFGHRYEHPGMYGARGEIWCYTDAFSDPPGDAVRLDVSWRADRYRLAILRDGATASPVLAPAIAGAPCQDTPEHCSVLGSGCATSPAFPIEHDW